MNEAYLCLCGNLGKCFETFAKTILLLSASDIETTLNSSIYTSADWGMEKAPDFYNQVIKVRTKLKSEELMAVLQNIEKALGRVRTNVERYESRTIDIDLLFFNSEIIANSTLEVPHPRLHLRRFVLEPLHEIAPGLIHPVLKKSVSVLLQECSDKNKVKISHAI